ncbi:MAG: HAD family phosphatase [Firmicutes bacterium]|nr:HAD family phosphatase [Bacillota bacterium]
MKDIDAIVFDMDGVLFDTERVSRDCWRQIAKEHQIEGIDEVYPMMIGVNHTDGLEIFRKIYGEGIDGEAFLAECGVLMKKRLHEEGLPLKQGVLELLEYLRQNQIPAAICSSTAVPVIKDHLMQAHMESYFQAIIGGNMVLHSKPQPDIYLKACEELGKDPARCMAIEDSPNGIRSASAAGMIPVMIPDLVEPTDELRALSFRVEKSLTSFLTYLTTLS